MNVLLISDDPEKKSFDQILNLKKDIEEEEVSVDLIVAAEEGVLLDGGKIGEPRRLIESVRKVLGERSYSIVAISLTRKNLTNLLQEDHSILDYVSLYLPQTDVFIFGAPSLLKRLNEKKPHTTICSRPGVDKSPKHSKET